MANKPIQCSCNHGNSVKISPSLSDVTMALIDSKKGTQAASSMLYFDVFTNVVFFFCFNASCMITTVIFDLMLLTLNFFQFNPQTLKMWYIEFLFI